MFLHILNRIVFSFSMGKNLGECIGVAKVSLQNVFPKDTLVGLLNVYESVGCIGLRAY